MGVIKIYFFGDSICFGQYVSPHLTWVHAISERLDPIGREHAASIIVQNPSVNGDTTSLALERLNFDVIFHRPDVVYVQFGMNDCNHRETDNGRPRVSDEDFTANLREIIAKLLAGGTRAVILANNHPSTKIDLLPGGEVTYERSNAHYNGLVRKIGEEHNAYSTFIDLEAAFSRVAEEKAANVGDALMADGVHLGRLGHEIYTEIVWPKVSDVVTGLMKA
ncbi:MAG: hypothetical protein CMM60_01970 [Rhodospirillaceae bacterium]|jgi:lysophospholipase L1-like esterase|nr:hypothetical protein [Rhodospirillaceae bacterium]|tara:strand:- start:2976 stop:3638 length:663 start_codon:yes stop_codon:yes gene_type:complete